MSALGRAAAAAALLAGGCGVTTQGHPRSITDDRLQSLQASSLPEPPATRPGAVAFTLYLIGGERLRAVPRAVVGPVRPADRLDALRAGPTAQEAATGLRSAVDQQATVHVSRVEGTVATVDLPPELADLLGSDQTVALAQIVYSLTDDPALDAVAFTVNGAPASTPVQDGTLIGRPVGRGDFPAFA